MWLVTSIPAKSQEDYVDAFKSWENVGIKIFTINTKEELGQLDERFFAEKKLLASYDYSDNYGRPLVGINEALLKLSEIAPKGEVIGIVNADIFPFNYFNWNDSIEAIGDEDIFIYKRTDYDEISGANEIVYNPQVYKYGYDLFLIRNTENIKSILSNHRGNLAFGVPWWDYFFPIKCLQSGYNVISYENCSILHKKHKEQFSQDLWKKKGEEFKRFLLESLRDRNEINRIDSFDVDLISLCEKTIRYIDSQKFINNNDECVDLNPGISIVTACMNRNDNLVFALKTWLKLEEVNEIIIVDWSSSEKVSDTLNNSMISDERIRIVRKDNEKNWNLCKAYNLGFKNITYSNVLKLDADVELGVDFFNSHILNDQLYYSGSWKTAKNDSEKRLNGSFYTKTSNIFKIGGYNEIIDTYGWDDSDLYLRLSKLAKQQDFNTCCIFHLDQTEESRTENSKENVIFESLHPSIFTELEIRKNEWKAFLCAPILPFFNVSYDTVTISEEYCYKKAIIGFLSKPYESSGLGLKESFLNRLSLETLHNLFVFRHCSFSWKETYRAVLENMSCIPMSKEDNLIFLNHKDSPYMSEKLAIEKFPDVISNDFIRKNNLKSQVLFSRPGVEKDELLLNSFFYKNLIQEKSIGKKVTIPVVLFNAEEFVEGLLEDIEAQVAFSDCLFVFVIADKHEYPSIYSFCNKYSESTALVSLMYDPGLYGCWNYVISYSLTKYISNWNADDRRDPLHIKEMINFLDSNPTYAAACSGLYVSRRKNKSFLECDSFDDVWFDDICESFNHTDLFQKMNWLANDDPKRETVVSQNYLHCMPVWRRSLHDKFGFFNEEKYGASADWEFWLRCGLGGENFYRLSKVLGVYFLNEQSYGRATKGVEEKEKNIFIDYFKFSKLYKEGFLHEKY